MDTNRDGIIDDPLATKKVGRKPLNLNEAEWKDRKREQRKQRLYKTAVDERLRMIVAFGVDAIRTYEIAKAEAQKKYDNEVEVGEAVDYAMHSFYSSMAESEFLIIKPLPKFRS